MLAYKGSEVSEDPVKVLEALLVRAREGGIVGISFAICTSSNEVEIAFVGSALDNPFEVLGILSLMQTELADNIRRQLRLVHSVP